MAINSDIKYQHPGVLLLRYTVSILMLFHGVSKLGGVGPIEGMLQSVGLPPWFAFGVMSARSSRRCWSWPVSGCAGPRC
jgi:putative oxidoreductase